MKTKVEIESLLQSVAKAQTTREKLVAQRDAAMREAGAKYAPGIEDADKLITAALSQVEAWCEANPAEFGEAQSIVLAQIRIGWRRGKWAAVFVEGMKESDAVDHLLSVIKEAEGRTATPVQREAARWAKMLLVTSYGLDKALLVKFSDEDAVLNLAGDAGISIEQKRRFFVEPVREGQKSKRIEAA